MGANNASAAPTHSWQGDPLVGSERHQQCGESTFRLPAQAQWLQPELPDLAMECGHLNPFAILPAQLRHRVLRTRHHLTELAFPYQLTGDNRMLPRACYKACLRNDTEPLWMTKSRLSSQSYRSVSCGPFWNWAAPPCQPPQVADNQESINLITKIGIGFQLNIPAKRVHLFQPGFNKFLSADVGCSLNPRAKNHSAASSFPQREHTDPGIIVSQLRPMTENGRAALESPGAGY